MLQMADVGIGISGQEGMQAVMASDFALPRFCMLRKLLLVHGHWCYDRLARMILFMFYKNAVSAVFHDYCICCVSHDHVWWCLTYAKLLINLIFFL